MKLLYVGTEYDKPFLPRMKDIMGAHTLAVSTRELQYKTELEQLAAKAGTNKILLSNKKLLAALLNWNKRAEPSLSDYAGSFIEYKGLEIVVVPPAEWLIKVNYGKFLYRRYISKHTEPDTWLVPPAFHMELLHPGNLGTASSVCDRADFVAVDIETELQYGTGEPYITCCSWTAVNLKANTAQTYVLEIKHAEDKLAALYILRHLNLTAAPKLFQNGKYDIAYLTRWNAAPYNYRYDTATFFHCWYSELPKDLGFLNAFLVRKAMYWKDLAQTEDRSEYLRYNALDTWGTAVAFMAMIKEAPTYAFENYKQEFPLLFPCHMAEMSGIKLDEERRQQALIEVEGKIDELTASLHRMTNSSINANSHVQVKKLLAVLGVRDAESSDEKSLKKASYAHPLNSRILETILSIREHRKVASTYLVDGKDFRGRMLFAINPHGTDSGRLASKSHHFWCGYNIQNITRGTVVKQIFVADPGFEMYECDLEQAESRDTAHIAGCEALITAVSGTQDFHSLNASAFFGRSYSEIYCDTKRKTLDKALRDLAKRVNHGANYNMGPNVLVDTMGLEKIYEAARLLKLPKGRTPKQIAEHLLAAFHTTYPEIGKVYYPGVVKEVTATQRLTSTAQHDAPYQATRTGWTRHCFGRPDKNKQDLNSYVAHPPQSLNAMTLNKAYLRVFYELALAYPEDFKLGPQIHDSIFFQVRIGRSDLAELVRNYMEIPVTVRGYDKARRSFTVPAALKGPAPRWSETE